MGKNEMKVKKMIGMEWIGGEMEVAALYGQMNIVDTCYRTMERRIGKGVK